MIALRAAMSSDNFYSELPVLSRFSDVSQTDGFRELPDDWHVVLTDVVRSTEAVRQGRYREVNTLGAASIMGVLNAVNPIRIPYVFGGDGAAMCVPMSVLPAARTALIATRRMAEQEFGLALRAGIVPARRLREAGRPVLVARVQVSEHYAQAAFTGGGIALAEHLIKHSDQASSFLVEDNGEVEAVGDYQGLECRWDSIPGPRGEVVTLLVQALGRSPQLRGTTYEQVLADLARTYGDPEQHRPVSPDGLRLTLSAGKLKPELRVQFAGRSGLRRALASIQMRLENLVGRGLLRWGIKAGGTDWGQYRRDVIANSDFRKFDDQLRHVLSGTPGQRAELVQALDRRYAAGELAYGLHHSSAAVMTCLVFARIGEHVHFVDGADGGYTMAAADLKRRLAALAPEAEVPI